jgi:N-acetylneuraminate epimerase
MTQLTLLLLFLMENIPNLNWRTRPDLPIAAAGGYSAVLQGKVVHAGGTTWENGVKRFLNETYIYDPSTSKWSEGPKLPEPLAYGAFASGPRGLEIYGGTDGERSSRQCYLLKSVSGHWEKCAGDAGDTLLSSAQRSGDEVFVFGGCPNMTDLARCQSEIHVRDDSGPWRSAGKLPRAGVSLSASASLNGAIYLFGGVSATAAGGIENRADAYRFDVKQRRWTTLTPLPRAARGMAAVPWDSRYILLVGGYVATQAEATGKSADFGFSGDVHVYDTVTGRYIQAGALPLPCAGLALLRSENGVFAIGGEQRMRARSAQFLWGAIAKL